MAIKKTAWKRGSSAPSAAFARGCKIGMTNLAYNIRRFTFLDGMAPATG
ncbi:MAG: hypothetical protein ACREC0_01210 [Methylocella sp.]